MKQLFYKNLLYCTFILLSINVCGQSRASKEIKNTFSLTDNGALFLSNKYGDIFINGWDKDSIQILTDIEVKGKKIDRAKELLNRISTNIVNSKNQVIVKSEITKKENLDSFESFSKWAQILLQDFNEIDQHLIDTKEIFVYLRDIQRLKKWSVTGTFKETELIKDHYFFLEKLNTYYNAFYTFLLEKKSGYQGLLYREASKKIDDYLDKNKHKKFFFIGFKRR